METMLLWGLALLAIAALLVVVDIFVPTAGVLSLVSLTIAVAAVVCLFRYSTAWGLTGLLVVVVGGPTAAYIGLQVMPNTYFGRMLILDNPDTDSDERAPGAPPSPNQLAALIGKQGVVVSDLRPVGVIRVDDRHYDALSETTLVRAGSAVRVTSVEGTQIKVRPVQA